MFTSTRMSLQASVAISEAHRYALENGDCTVRPDHLLRALLEGARYTVVGELLAAFQSITLELLLLSQAFWEVIGLVPRMDDEAIFSGSPAYDDAFQRVIELAAREADTARGGTVDLQHLLIGIACEPTSLACSFMLGVQCRQNDRRTDICAADYVALRIQLSRLSLTPGKAYKASDARSR